MVVVYLEAEAEFNHEVMRKGRVEETLTPPGSFGCRTITPFTAMSSLTEPRKDSRSGDSCVRTGMRPRRLRSGLEVVETMVAGSDRRKMRKMRRPMLAR